MTHAVALTSQAPGFHTCEIRGPGPLDREASDREASDREAPGEGLTGDGLGPYTRIAPAEGEDPDRGPCPGCPGRLRSDVRHYPARGYLIAHRCPDCGYRNVL